MDTNQIINIATPIAAPLVMALLKWVLPKIPSWLIPILCTTFGAVGNLIAHYASANPQNVMLAVSLALAGIGVREIVDQLKPKSEEMKKLITLLAAVVGCGLLIGCGTPLSHAFVKTTVMTGASATLLTHPEAKPALDASEMVICNMAGSTDLTPEKLVATLTPQIKELNSPVGQLAANWVISVYESVWAWLGPNVTSSKMGAYLPDICAGLQAADPLPTAVGRAASKTAIPAPGPFIK